MITDPVTSTAPELIESPNAAPASASVAARSMASPNRGTTVTRSSPKTSRAVRASCSAGIARSVEFWVTTTWSSTGSKASSTPA